MKLRSCICFLALVVANTTTLAQTPRSSKDDTLHFQSPETIVTGFPIEPNKNVAPVEHIGPTTIKALSTEQDVAKIASITPSATFYSESGIDIGYTHVSLRGVDQKRISVMVNGIPQNGPEDQEVYWIDMPGLQASASAIDVQRGAGTAFYGPPAIGGSINVRTDLSPIQSIKATASYGSYNTSTYSLEASSGLVFDKYIFYGRLGRTHTDGYRHDAWLNRTPYFIGIARYDSNMTTQFNAYGGPFDDGLAYYGLPDKSYLFGPDSARRTNLSETWNYERRPGEGEHFSQPHYELLNEWTIGPSTRLYNTLFYIRGDGYFDIDGTWPESTYKNTTNADYYRLTQAYAERYGFTSVVDSLFTNQLYRGFVGNDHWGWLPRIEWQHDGGTLNVAGELRLHRGDHYGQLLSANGLPSDLPSDYHFYEFHVAKDIGNVSAIDQFDLAEGVQATAGVQLVNEQYRFYDQSPLYVDSAMAAHRSNISTGWTSYQFTVPFTFLNPRVGVRASLSENVSGFASASITSREPKFSDYYAADFWAEPNFELDGFGGYNFSRPNVHPETVTDLELGVELGHQVLSSVATLSTRVNGYLMSFKDEIIPSGNIDNFGAPVQLNARATRHYGVEAEATLAIDWISLAANLALSHNEILEMDANALGLPASAIGSQPPGAANVIANGILTLQPASWLRLDVLGRYNGGYYADIPNTEEHHLDPFFVADAVLSLRIPDVLGAGFIDGKFQVNNVLDRNYAAAVNGGGFFPGAPRNFLATVSVGL